MDALMEAESQSPTPGLFRVLRPFYIDGELLERDAMVPLAAHHVISMLIETGKIEPADEATRARLRKKDVIAWEESKTEPTAAAGILRRA